MMEADSGFQPPARTPKPRMRGLTSVIDFGPDGFGWTGPAGVRDLLACAADYIDFAKIYAMNALLMPKAVVAEIVGLYRDADVTPYAGGILFEYAARKEQLPEYVAHLKSVGLTTAEISENYVSFGEDERNAHFERLQEAGIEVIYEFGSKNPTDALDPDQLEAIIRTTVERGVRHVILEQSEIDCLREQAPERLPEIVAQPWFERVMIEADPYAFPAQHAGLLRDYGSDISLANIAAGQALRLEGMRRGIGRSVNYAMFEGSG